jgi:predicted transcriptional regulator
MLRAKRPRKPLSELEHLVMDVLWKRSRSTAEDVREGLAERYLMKDSTARTILKQLEERATSSITWRVAQTFIGLPNHRGT